MASEGDFAQIEGANFAQAVTQEQAWAQQKFGALYGEYKPDENEVGLLWTYWQQHPGAPTADFVSVLANARGLKSNAAKKTVANASPANTPTSAAGTPKASPAKPASAFGAAAAQVANGALNNTAINSDSLDLSNPVPVFVQTNVSAPDAGLPGATRSRLSPGDQLATGTGDTTGPVKSTVQDELAGFYKMDAAHLKALKQQLWASGYYPPGTDKSVVDSTIPDQQTRTAYLAALQQTARLNEAGQQSTVQSVIAAGNPNPASSGASTLGGYAITSPVDLKSALQNAAQTHLGRDLTPAEMGDFTKLYNGMEAQSSQRMMAANRNNQEVGVVQPPSPGSASEDYLAQHFQAQEQAYGAVQRQQAFYGLLGPIS